MTHLLSVARKERAAGWHALLDGIQVRVVELRELQQVIIPAELKGIRVLAQAQLLQPVPGWRLSNRGEGGGSGCGMALLLECMHRC